VSIESGPSDRPEDIERDVKAVGRIDSVPPLLKVICETTGMGFAAVARVTDGTWTACAVHDLLNFGLVPGGQLDLHTTLCKEVRETHQPIVIDHASADARYCNHHTPRTYQIESYVSVPIVMPDGSYFGNLCAIDPKPAQVDNPRVRSLFTLFAELIALQLENDRKRELEQAALLSEREAGELRDQFIAILGHDLRNPLASVLTCGELLQAHPTRVDVPQLARRITTNVHRMTGLINNVLDFARGRLGGGIALQIEVIPDLALVLADVVAELQDAHPGRRIEQQVEVHAPIAGDRNRIQQLMSNLLANALTHGAPDQPVQLVARIAGDHLELSVANGGQPIPPDSLARIFRPFWRASGSLKSGLGLGLYICAQIVQAHGGRIDVVSTATDGTRFVAQLPLTA
jgi:signal transduction histidine kinase